MSPILAALLISSLPMDAHDVPYEADGQQFVGYVAYPAKRMASMPAVLIVHQYFGLTDYEKSRAQQLAALGYVAFAADIYGKGVRATSPQEAGGLAGKYKGDRTLFRDHLSLAFKTMLKQPGVNAKKTAAIGYCFGGTGVLELARTGANTLGVVSFHGGLDSPTPDDGKKIHSKVLVLAGADDPFQKKSDLDAFNQEMALGNVDYRYIAYPGAVHAFTQPSAGSDNSKGAAYNADADKKSWTELKAFLKSLFK